MSKECIRNGVLLSLPIWAAIGFIVWECCR